MNSIRLTLVAGIALTAMACTSHTVKKVNSVQAVNAETELSADALLDVGLVVFDPNVPEDEAIREKKNIFPEVREAEARYLPYVMRDTLEKTNQWGAVRVVPNRDPAAELLVSGQIMDSDGFDLKVRVWARDSTGRVWLDKEYEDTATQFAYRDDIDYPGDPFQDLYNMVANDLSKARAKLTARELREIRTVADLRYAAELSPSAFGDHLTRDDRGNYEINRLPAPNDPMMQRVSRIRETEYLFIDTVDQQYGAFYRQMDPSYDSWRRFSYEETIALEELRRSARARTMAGMLGVLGGAALSSKASNSTASTVGNLAALGGLTAMKQGYDTYKESKIHEEALKELATSFDAEVKPIVIEVEGEVVKLSGSLDAQYNEWRQILRKIYSAEVGLPVSDADTSQ